MVSAVLKFKSYSPQKSCHRKFWDRKKKPFDYSASFGRWHDGGAGAGCCCCCWANSVETSSANTIVQIKRKTAHCHLRMSTHLCFRLGKRRFICIPRFNAHEARGRRIAPRTSAASGSARRCCAVQHYNHDLIPGVKSWNKHMGNHSCAYSCLDSLDLVIVVNRQSSLEMRRFGCGMIVGALQNRWGNSELFFCIASRREF